jgi:ClpP class serine protease
MSPLDLLWIFFLASSLQPMLQQWFLARQRAHALRALEKERGSRAITMIHRREGFAFLGIPFGGFIDIEDSEAVIRAIESTGKDVPIDLVLHTPGGLVLAAEQIAAALAAHPAPVTVYVPHYAMSGGTLIALAADKIVMSPSAVLGPVDPQIDGLPVASLLAAVQEKDRSEVEDRTLVLADVGRKAQHQVATFVARLLEPHLKEERAREIARVLSVGRWTHDFPIDVELADSLGLPVSTDLPEVVRTLMALYPQTRGRRPSVEYIPGDYEHAPRSIPPARHTAQGARDRNLRRRP